MFEIDLLIECRDNYDFLSGRQRARIDYIVNRYEKAQSGYDGVMAVANNPDDFPDADWDALERRHDYYVHELCECRRMADDFRKECGWFETIAYRNLRPTIGVFNG